MTSKVKNEVIRGIDQEST